MAKSNKFNVDMGGTQTDLEEHLKQPAPATFERNEKRGPGRPIGKRSNPAFGQFTVLLRKETHHRILTELRKHEAKPDFGEYVEKLILQDLATRGVKT